MKKIFLLLLFLSLIPAQTAHTQGLDLRCVTKETCIQERERLIGLSNATGADAEAGFQSAENNRDIAASCNGTTMYGPDGEEAEAGFCLAVTTANTAIRLGGKNQFDSIADYISTVYSYSLIVASVIATLMLIVGAIQWIASGGNPQNIDTAKKRIANALTGVLLLATSYVILYTIDPNLTRLSPPDAYILRKIETGDPQCKNVKGKPAVAEAGEIDAEEQKDVKEAFEAGTIPNEEAKCGYEYYFAGGETQLCKGHFCSSDPAKPAVCASDLTQDREPNKTYVLPKCHNGNIVGNIYASNFFESGDNWIARFTLGLTPLDIFNSGEGWVWEWANRIELYTVCGDGTVLDGSVASANLRSSDESKRTIFFSLTAPESELDGDANLCLLRGHGDAVGYVLYGTFNEFADSTGGIFNRGHYLGEAGGYAVDLGPYYVGFGFLNKCIFSSATAQDFLFTKEEILEGVKVDIDVSQIADTDSLEAGDILWNIPVSSWVGLGINNPLIQWYAASSANKAVFDGVIKEMDSYYGSLGLNTASCFGYK